MLRNTSETYGSIAKLFHWTISILVITLLIVGASLDLIPQSSKGTVINIHKLVGLTTLTLIILRIVWAILNTKPSLINVPTWMRIASRLTHKVLYVLILIMPISGWVMATAAGPDKYPHLFNLKLGMPFIAQSKALATTAKEIHEITAWILLTFLILHVTAALYHHFIRRDNVLARMLPGRK